MIIQVNRELKIMLLSALRDGCIDTSKFVSVLLGYDVQQMTDEQLDKELNEFTKKMISLGYGKNDI